MGFTDKIKGVEKDLKSDWEKKLPAIIERVMREPSFKKRIDELNTLNHIYGGDKFKLLGKGSARAVYDLGNGTVLKVAINAKGLAQNEAESSIDDYPILNKINDALSDKQKYLKFNKVGNSFAVALGDGSLISPAKVDTNRYLVVEKAQKVTKKLFKEMNGGVSFDEVESSIRDINTYEMGFSNSYPSEAYDKLTKSPIGQEISDLLVDYEGHFCLGDFCSISSYGLVKDSNSENKIVITDSGLTKEVYDNMYKKEYKYNNNYKP